MSGSDLVARSAALRRTKAWLSGRAFAWETADCIAMLSAHLEHNGHGGLPKQSYRSALGAKRALKKAGFDNLEQLLDSLLPRIAPAQMLPGDVALAPGDPEGLAGTRLDALVIGFGRKCMGWVGGHDEAVVMTEDRLFAAWRIEPLIDAEGRPR